MNDIKNIENTLVKMIDLLRLSGVDNWADALKLISQELATRPKQVASKILSMYGGMGSLNDVILYRDGQPLSKENTEFDDLRTSLYDLCQKLARLGCR
ncbi:MAG: hypothetical protein L3J75_16605 [Methylococcaceae bacterium]|nr:hypothetical protein [Methylococcaceae bacterium]